MKKLDSYISTIDDPGRAIEADRKDLLEYAAGKFSSKLTQFDKLDVIAICTHNSRRSHLVHVWAMIAADHHGLSDRFRFYSGGTEGTLVYPETVHALNRAGVTITPVADGGKSEYVLNYGSSKIPIFSKRYDDPVNPGQDFIALVVCSHADQNCPVIPNALDRISLPYEDPGRFDGTEKEVRSGAYDEACREIAVEMVYLFSLL